VVRAAAASALVASRLQDGRLAGLPPRLRPDGEVGAYLVQRAAHVMLESAGFGRRAGWKIGCTTPVMQAYLGISTPCAGAMFQANIWHGRHAFAIPTGRRLGVECEIAVRLGRDLDLAAAGTTFAAEQVAGSVAACMAAIEVVEDRYENYSTIDTPTLIADDFFHHSCVLGREVEDFDPTELSSVTASMKIGGSVVGEGGGSAILGDPLRALTWLAGRCVELGTPLLAGEYVLLGSLVQTNWVSPGDLVEVDNDPFGTVEAEFFAD
jgi:2-oxo-3-hexenedioate decarboxylase/2-keto-4-pentenoate hydratase